ncbi:YciI family protein [Kribbella catacumbae]|uniref:YciI family protein n=1 Tax=Kribbella catacumbae TaxID=460086 RepID=UPI001ED9BCE9|nr:hypothetical protein [Kribbella catacumbae]
MFVETEQFAKDLEAMNPDEREQAYQRVNRWFIDYADKIRGGHKLQGAHTATTLRLDGPSPITTDGPFVEGKEVVSGYTELEVDDSAPNTATSSRTTTQLHCVPRPCAHTPRNSSMPPHPTCRTTTRSGNRTSQHHGHASMKEATPMSPEENKVILRDSYGVIFNQRRGLYDVNGRTVTMVVIHAGRLG